jgi:hypothetical protein
VSVTLATGKKKQRNSPQLFLQQRIAPTNYDWSCKLTTVVEGIDVPTTKRDKGKKEEEGLG